MENSSNEVSSTTSQPTEESLSTSPLNEESSTVVANNEESSNEPGTNFSPSYVTEPTHYESSVTPPSRSNATVSLLIMFLVGALAGFFGRPLVVTPEVIPPQVVIVTATPDVAAIAKAQTSGDKEVIVVTATPEPTPDYMKELLSKARHFQGDANAPITMIEFSDFKCGYCGKFAIETLEQIREQYVKTGKVRFVYKQFAILGPESQRAAEATECAAEQDKFWPLHDLIFKEEATNHTPLDDATLSQLAGKVGIETATFDTCLASGRNTNLISEDRTYIQSLGVRGTPGFLINGVYVSGAQPIEAFQEIIEKQLKDLGKS